MENEKQKLITSTYYIDRDFHETFKILLLQEKEFSSINDFIKFSMYKYAKDVLERRKENLE